MPSQNEIREKITTTIIQALESGNLPPWRMPWKSDPNAGFPQNIVSNRPYRGINPLLLQIASMRHGFQSRWWATYRQWETLCAKVKKRPDNIPPGEWGCNIIYFSPFTVRDTYDDEKEKTVFLLKTYTVFNLEQVQVQGSHLDRFRVGHSLSNDTDCIF